MLAAALIRNCSTRALAQGVTTRSFASGAARQSRRRRVVDPPPPPYYYACPHGRMCAPHPYPYGYYHHCHGPWGFGRFLLFGLGIAVVARVASGGNTPCPKEWKLKAQTREAEAFDASGEHDAIAKSTAAATHSWCPKERFKAQKQDAEKSGTPGSDSELPKL